MIVLVRESAIALLCIISGLLIVRFVSYPDTAIDIGVGYAERDGEKIRAVLLDFDTPTTEQMAWHRSVEEFDAWALQYAGSRMPGADRLPLVRVPSLSGSSCDTVLHYTIPLTGFSRMRDQMIPPQLGFIGKTWVIVLVPYAGVVGVRAVRRLVRRRRTSVI